MVGVTSAHRGPTLTESWHLRWHFAVTPAAYHTNWCSMLPPFDERGLLPPTVDDNPYSCDVVEIEKRFVDDLGAPSWRVRLFDGWDILRRGVAVFVPSARWWLWDCFISNHPEPLFGEYETMQCIVILPTVDLPREEHEIAMLVDFIRSAQARHGVDVTMVLEYPPGHPDNLDTIDALEGRWRPRAVLNVGDHIARIREPAGFVEVLP